MKSRPELPSDLDLNDTKALATWRATQEGRDYYINTMLQLLNGNSDQRREAAVLLDATSPEGHGYPTSKAALARGVDEIGGLKTLPQNIRARLERMLEKTYLLQSNFS